MCVCVYILTKRIASVKQDQDGMEKKAAAAATGNKNIIMRSENKAKMKITVVKTVGRKTISR